MQKGIKERIFYLDFIRAIAVVLIIITHYNAVFVFGMDSTSPDRCVITEYPFGIYVGDLGVSLFLIISGAALMYVYEEGKLDLKLFYKKRFMAIYPMFWIAYIVAVIPKLAVWRSMGYGLNWKILITFIGMDGYLSEYVSAFYILGEWFLGFIVIFYVIFPFIRWLMNKNEIVLWIAVLCLYVLCLKYYDMQMSMSKIIFVRLPELCFGMSFIKHRVRLKWYHALPAAGILALNAIIRPEFLESLQTTYVGISFFAVLVFISYYTGCVFVKRICSFVSKYSYAVFLVHHVVIEYIQAGFDMTQFSVLSSYALFAVTAVFIFVTAVLLNISSKAVTDAVNKKLCRQ